MGNVVKDKVAVITGAGRGLGKAYALLMAEEGAKVVVNDLGGATDGTGDSREPAEEVVAEIKRKGGTAVANYASVATPEGGENIIKAAVDNFGRIDILVNNAGITRDRMVFKMSEEDWDLVMKVHLYGAFHCIKPAVAVMRQQQYGRIINITSRAFLGNPGQSNYGAAKAGVVGLTRTLARELARYGITCNTVFPGAKTRMSWTPELVSAWEKRAAEGDAMAKSVLENLSKQEPEDVAPLVVFLASDTASNISGYTFRAAHGTIILFSDPVPLKTLYKSERWTVEELVKLIPATLAAGLVSPPPLPAM